MSNGVKVVEIEKEYPALWPKGIGCGRVSTIGQEEHGYGLETQIELILRAAEQRQIAVNKIYLDVISGAEVDEEDLTVDRPGLIELMAELSTGEYSYVVVARTDRLWRGDLAKVLIQRNFKKAGVDIVSHDQPDYSLKNASENPSAYLVNGIFELVDVYQRLELILKLKRGRYTKAGKGRYAGGGNPIGYSNKRGSKHLTVDEEKAEAVRACLNIKEEYPHISLSQIAEILNNMGFTTREGKAFTKVQVHRILKRKALYEGKQYTYGGVIAPSEIPKII